MQAQLSLPIAPIAKRVYRPRGINDLQILFKKHFQSIAEHYESKYAVIYGRFRIERITEVVEKFILCGDHITYIARLLGHASLRTTQKYVHVEISDLKQMHSLYHPRERII